MKDHHPVPASETGYTCSHFGYNAGSFVSKYPRRRMRAGADLLQVGSANAATVNANQYFARLKLWHRNALDAHVIPAMIDSGMHMAGKSPRFRSPLRLGSNRHS